MRIVVDTNIVVSAFLWGGAPQRLLSIALAHERVLISSEPLLKELETTLNKPKLEKFLLAGNLDVANIIERFKALVSIVDPIYIPSDVVRDKDDNVVIGTAITGKANFIVTGDKDLLVLEILISPLVQQILD